MNVIDSSAWLEYFADGPNAEFFAPAIDAPEQMLVPSITLLEVFKRVFQQRGEGAALQCVAVMQQGTIVELDAGLAIRAAALGLRHRLPLADSIVYATTLAGNATLWTQDGDFENLPQVEFRRKTS